MRLYWLSRTWITLIYGHIAESDIINNKQVSGIFSMFYSNILRSYTKTLLLLLLIKFYVHMQHYRL